MISPRALRPDVIRRATPQDLAAIHQLEKACFGRRSFSREHVAHVLTDPRSATFLFLEGERLLGSIMVNVDGGVARIISVAVHPRHQRRGIGRRLMALAEGESQGRGAREIRLEVSVNNEGAIQFYRILGYDLEGRLPRYYSWGEDAYVMAKPLSQSGNV